MHGLFSSGHPAHRCPPRRLHREGASGKNGTSQRRTTLARTLRLRADLAKNIHLPSAFPIGFFRDPSHKPSRLDGTKKFNHGLHGAHGSKSLNSMVKSWRTIRCGTARRGRAHNGVIQQPPTLCNRKQGVLAVVTTGLFALVVSC